MAMPKGNLKPEHPEQGGGKRDTFTADSGAALVAKVMGKAESSHAKGSTTGAEFKLGTNQAYHVSGTGGNNFGE
jgi:hypothetical protein